MTEKERTGTGAGFAGKGAARGKSVILKLLRNYLVANVCALLPLLWVGLGWMPDQVKISWRGEDESPVAIMCGRIILEGEDNGRWEEGRVWKYYLRNGMEWKDLAFRLPEGTGGGNVGRIELLKWRLLKWGKAGTGLKPVAGLENGWRFENPRFERAGFVSQKMLLGGLFLELLLLGLSWLFATRHREESWKTLWPSVVCVALVLSALLQVAVPVQSYLANRSTFAFSPGELAMAVSLRFVWVWILTTVALLALSRCFGRLVLALVLAVTICMDLEASVLAAGLPDLNGDWWFFRNKTRALWDATAWGAVFVFLLALYPVVKRWLGWIAVGWLIVVTGASVFDVQREEHLDTSKLVVQDFSSFESVLRSVTYSTNRNVLVFVIDSLERERAHAIMEDTEAGARLREQFRGFTEYVDNVGTGNTTLTAVPTLFTGEYPSEVLGSMDFYWSMYGTNSALVDYLSAGWDVFMTASALGCGYAGNKNMAEEQAIDPKDSVWTRSTKGGQPWNLAGIARFRWLPFGIKAPYAYIVRSAGAGNNILREWNVYPVLEQAGFEQDSPGVFLLIHTEGVHLPVMYDRHGHLLAAPASGEDADKEMGVFILSELGKLFDRYRERGLYDKSFILVLADHGQHGEREFMLAEQAGHLPPNAYPFLWAKPAGSRNAFVASSLPTSHAQIAGLLKVLARKEVGKDEMEALLRSDERRYRWVALNGSGWKDGVVDKNGRISFEEFHPSEDSSHAALLPLKNGKTYFLSSANVILYKEGPVFSNVDNIGYPSLRAGQREMSFAFKVGKADRKHLLRFRIKGWDHSGMRFRQDAPESGWVNATLSGLEEQEVVLRGLLPDSEGVVKILGERLPGEDGIIRFTQLAVEEE